MSGISHRLSIGAVLLGLAVALPGLVGCGGDDDDADPPDPAAVSDALGDALLTAADVGDGWLPIERDLGAAGQYAGSIDVLASASTGYFGRDSAGIPSRLVHYLIQYPDGGDASAELEQRLNIASGGTPFTALGDRAIGATTLHPERGFGGTIIIRRSDVLSLVEGHGLEEGRWKSWQSSPRSGWMASMVL